MRTLHDARARQAIVGRIQSLRPDSVRRWGAMTIDQMLWHLNEAMRNGRGELEPPLQPTVLPRGLFRVLALRVPWPKGAPTAPAFVAGARYDFEEQRAALLGSVAAFAARDIAGPWARHPGFGKMRGRDWSRLMHKHIDHHLRQFGA